MTTQRVRLDQINAVGRYVFDMAGATPADGTGSGNNPPVMNVLVSTGTQPTNGPKLTLIEWLFPITTDSHVMWAFNMPSDYNSAPVLKGILYNKTVQAGGVKNFQVKAALAAVTPGEDVPAKVFPAPDTQTVVLASNQAAGVSVAFSIALSATAQNSVAGDDAVVLFIGRDADHASDTAAGNLALVGLVMEYTRQ